MIIFIYQYIFIQQHKNDQTTKYILNFESLSDINLTFLTFLITYQTTIGLQTTLKWKNCMTVTYRTKLSPGDKVQFVSASKFLCSSCLDINSQTDEHQRRQFDKVIIFWLFLFRSVSVWTDDCCCCQHVIDVSTLRDDASWMILMRCHCMTVVTWYQPKSNIPQKSTSVSHVWHDIRYRRDVTGVWVM